MKVEKLPVILKHEDLRAYTDNFSDENYIGEFQFGKIYHGKISQPGSAQSKPVTVKMWEIPKYYQYYPAENSSRLMDEAFFLQANSHPGLMKLHGYYCDTDECGIVYDFKSLNTIQNLATSDDFKWWQRLKVALRLAHLLRFLHVKYRGERPLLIRNIDAAHILVDEDWNPKLCDFGMITGGPFPDKLLFPVQHLDGCIGYSEPTSISHKSDVFAFGVILLSLIMKDSYTVGDGRPCMQDRAFAMYKGHTLEELLENIDLLLEEKEEDYKFSLVHKTLEDDESYHLSDGPVITRLAQACVETFPRERPTTKEVIHRLQKLKAVRRNPNLNVYIKQKVKKENN